MAGFYIPASNRAILKCPTSSIGSTLHRESNCPRMIVMDNNPTHLDEVIACAIEAEGHIVQFLPPYSPDFNPIQLISLVLKAWL